MTQDRDRRHIDRGMTGRGRQTERCTGREKQTGPERMRMRDTVHDGVHERESKRNE